MAAAVASIWGFNFVVISWGMSGDGREVPPLLFAAVRFALVAVPAVFFIPRPNVAWRTVVAIGSFMSLGQFAFLYLAMDQGLAPGLAALVLQAQVIFTIVIAALALSERPSAVQTAGVTIGSIGLVVVAAGRGGGSPFVPLLLCLMGALSWGVGNVISRASGASSGLSLTVWSATIVPVPMFVLSLMIDGPSEVRDAVSSVSWQAGVSTLYTVVLASLVGYTIFNSLLGRYESAAVVPWVLLAPAVAMASAWLLLGDRPATGELVGGGLLVIGVLVALRPARVASSVSEPMVTDDFVPEPATP
ncbi:MAG TPA: EamA family transporter [Ilumatobacter sp.]|nr:EamA family transporter [Ilumatobacter sp.]